MASQLYSRYVPPKNTNIILQKPTDSTTLPSNIIFSATQKISDGEPPQQLHSPHLINEEYSKAPKRKHENDDDMVDGELRRKKRQEKDSGSHHKTLLKKKERAVKKSKELIEIAPIRVEESVEIHPLQPLPQPEHASKSTKTALPSALNIPLPFPVLVSADTGAPFTELGIPKAVASNLQSKGFDQAFPIQSAMIPNLLSRKPEHRGDILVSAATGSGKTLGYVLPMIADISQKSVPRLRALIIVPTRDLLYQTHKVCEIGASTFAVRGRRRVRVGTACGDVAYKQEVSNLMSSERFYDPAKSRKRDQLLNNKWCCSDYDTDEGDSNPPKGEAEKTLLNYVTKSKSKVDILICTPGRLVQHLQETKGFELNYIDWLIIDEVDRILNQTYQALIKNVMSSLSNDPKRLRTKILLSATLSTNVGDLSHLKLHNPKILVLEPNSVGSGDRGMTSDVGHVKSQTLKEFVIHLRFSGYKPLQLLKLLENEKIINNNDDSNSPRGALIFTNSNESAHRLGRLLQLLRPSMDSQIRTITSNVSKSVRTKLLRDFEERKLAIIIASDIMSRGIDLPSLGNVINYDMPTTQTSYIHRIGRTARAGKVGKAWTLFTGSKTQLAISQAEQTIPSDTLEMDLEVEATEMENFEIALKILAKEAGNS